MGQAVYAADAVTIPSGIDGRLRYATRDDAPLLRVWSEEFVAEAGVIAAPGDAIGRRIDAASLFVWEVDGTVVSMACVATLTARELAHQGRACMLYADLTNPTSNGIYQAIGYQRVGDAVDLTFTTPRVDGAPTSSEA